MLTLDQLKEHVSLQNAAERMGLIKVSDNGEQQLWKRAGAERPEISIGVKYQVWRDRNNQNGGHVIDLAMWVFDIDYPAANKKVHQLYFLPFLTLPEETEDATDDMAKLAYIAGKSLEDQERCRVYLKNERGIPDHIISEGIKQKR